MYSLKWDKGNTPAELHSLLISLGEEYAIVEGGSEEQKQILFTKINDENSLSISINDSEIKVEYNSIAQAARGVGAALSGLEEKSSTSFMTLGIMLDCSRNAVMKVDHLKGWMRRLALMGYNMVMLYTEDTYELPDEPFFGYQRGAYSMEEVKKLDAYASTLGIELVGCIQTLGHMEKTLRWPAYSEIKDTNGVMLVDSDATYQLIGKMLDFWSEALQTRRLHIGMDETHGLGTGRFKKIHGEEKSSDIYSRHLNKVQEICQDKGLEPMIWSDMIFNLCGGKSEGNEDVDKLLQEAKENVPEQMGLVHWDYYHEDKETYKDMILKHREIGHEPMMASGVWTWSRLWYDHEQTVATVLPCIEACRETNLKELFFTMWGDGGAFCEYDSSMAGLLWAANQSYGQPDDEEKLEQSYKALCDGDYKDCILASGMQGKGAGYYTETKQDSPLLIQASTILFDDPLYGRYHDNKGVEEGYWDKVKSRFESIQNHLKNNNSKQLEHAKNLVDALLNSLIIKKALRDAKNNDSKDALKNIYEGLLPSTLKSYENLALTLREQWMRRNKPEGFEGVQNKLNTTIGRYEEVGRIVEDIQAGKTEVLPGLM